jgi:hypothetical protein
MATSGHAMVDIDAGEASGGMPMRALVLYVLDFKDLSYSMKKRWEPDCLPSRLSNHLASVDMPMLQAGNMKDVIGSHTQPCRLAPAI